MMESSTNPHLPYSYDEAVHHIKSLTEWFKRLPYVKSFEDLVEEYSFLPGRVRLLNSSGICKYLHYGKAFGYRMLDGRTAHYSEVLPEPVRKFVTNEDRVLVIPSLTAAGHVYRVTFRSVFVKAFRFYTPLPHVPHGFLRATKPYHKPFLIVESAFDSDWLSQIYPYVMASSGVSGINREGIDLVANTSEGVVIAFDSDESGRQGGRTLESKLRQANPSLWCQQMSSPYGKDFGDIAGLMLTEGRESEYELYSQMVLAEFSRLGLC